MLKNDASKPLVIYRLHEIKTSFSMVSGRLILGCQAFYDPIEAGTNLYVALFTGYSQVDDISMLDKSVRIDTAEAALSFVRLKTSPETFYVFRKANKCREMEVIRKSDITVDFTFGDEAGFSVLKTSSDGYSGVISTKTAERLKIERTKVLPSNKGFEIQRTLLVEDYKTKQVSFVLVTEWVSKTGMYLEKRRVKRAIPLSSDVKWMMPRFK